MYPGLIVSGLIVLVFGLVLVLLGLLAFWIFMLIGGLMMLVGFYSQPREEVAPSDPDKVFCWYCMKEIERDASTCPYCGLPQRPRY